MKDLRDHYFGIASQCCDRLKKVFSSTGTTSRESSYAIGDVSRALVWMEEEIEELKGIMNARGDYCEMVGSRGMASILEKVGCEHIKAVVKASFNMDVEDIKNSSKEVFHVVERFYTNICYKGA